MVNKGQGSKVKPEIMQPCKLRDKADAVPVQSLPGKPYPQSTRARYPGFSTLPPQGEVWVAQEGCAGPSSVGFFPASIKQEAGAAAPHTVVALLKVFRDTKVPRHDRSALIKYLIDSKRKEVLGSERFKLVAYDASEDKSAGQRCIKWSFTVEDRGVPGHAGEVFMLGGWGITCAHPEVANLVVDIGYTQRFRQGGQWMTEFDTEAESFLKSLSFSSFYDSDYPIPLVIQSLEDYAILLKEKSREEEGKKIEQYAKIMLQSMQSAESSTYLGFAPDKVLREYSALLRQEGRNNKAKKMNRLADTWNQGNYKAATRRMEEYKKQEKERLQFPEYKFSIYTLPTDWNTIEPKPPGDVVAWQNSFTKSRIDINAYRAVSSISLKTAAEAYKAKMIERIPEEMARKIPGIKNSFITIEEEKEINIGGQLFRRIECNFGGAVEGRSINAKVVFYILRSDEFIYNLSLTSELGYYEKDKDVFERMIRAFRFIM